MRAWSSMTVWAAVSLAIPVGGVRAQGFHPSTDVAGEPPPCQILDKACGSQYAASLTYIPESRLDGYGKTREVALGATWEFAYYRDIVLADVDLRLDGGMTMFDPAGVDLPDEVIDLAVNAGITWRYIDNTALQVRARPGIYSELSGLGVDSFFMPFSGSLIWAVHPQLSGAMGVEIRPGFERTLLPLARLEWEASPDVRVSAGVPRSRVTYYGLRDWNLYGAFDWRSDSYRLDDGGAVDRKMITFEDFRLYAGAEYSVSAELRVIGELGVAMDRSLEFEASGKDLRREIDIDSELFIRIGVVGPF